MKSFLVILNNEYGHGYVPGGKDLAKLVLGIIFSPIVVPVLIIKKKIKDKKNKK